MKVALALIAFVAAIALLVRFSEARFAFFPLAGETTTPDDFGIPHQTLSIPTKDGEQLRAWLLGPHGPEAGHHGPVRPRAYVVYFHGNGGNLSVWAPILSGIARQGYSVLAFDYRGYGNSTGYPSERGLYRDVDAVITRFWQEPRQDVPVAYWGRSLGGTMAAYAATLQAPDGVILESAFPDVKTLVRMSPPMALLSLFSSYRFPTAAFMLGGNAPRAPVLVMHGDRDSVIPFGQGRVLFAKIPEPKRFFTISGGDHNDVAPPDPRGYWDAVGEFIASLSCR